MATPATPPLPGDILPTYRRVADRFAVLRTTALFERPMLDALERATPGRDLLDLGCGTGRPLAQHLQRRGFRLTGVDGAAPMLTHYRRNVPGARTCCRDMRGLALRQRFHALLAWNSFFHLDPTAQSRMFPVFAAHLRPGGVLVFSSGPARGEAYGAVDGAPVYHASHDPLCYRSMLTRAGFRVLMFRPEDPALDRHSWWLCRRT
ncbi:class I SAM-dependent DNA methyltransferase [Dinoroseobacter sp. S76]|uniref:class I SAM-dependent DNA methyltransferase n=1 Tax=Dinoroseobacter sp. S76 TaxID=3415124 RepID=UPI003C7BD5D8